MGDILSPQAGTLVTVRQTANQERVSQFGGVVVYNKPTISIAATESPIAVTFRQSADINVTQGEVLVASRGRVGNPRLRAWTFTLDGHDFYVLRLGDKLTLVYDISSEQWMDWADFGKIFWRPNLGMNWLGSEGLAHTYGSNVVIGDDTYGLVWFLDPDQPYDDHPDYLDPQQQRYFDRVVMGQATIRGREVLPCYAVWLTTDMGAPAYFGAGVTLEISDDAGATFDNMGTVTVTQGEKSPEVSWYSLGQIGAPGRLFKITDDGAVARIDGLEMNDPDDGR